jgi:hypothetical protein
VCAWQGWTEPKQLAYHIVGAIPSDAGKYLNNSCHQCGAMRLIDRSTQAPFHA